MEQENQQISWDDFEKIDMRVGTIIEAAVFEEVRNPAYKLMIDFGPLGVKKSSAQITVLYDVASLVDKQVIAVVNFPAKQIANIKSECLVLGLVEGKQVTLLAADKPVANGTKVG